MLLASFGTRASRPAFLAGLLASSLALASSSCGDASGGEVRLGMAALLGDEFGIANRQGVELAVSEINAAGGVNGKTLVIDFQDDSGSGGRAARIAQAFVEDVRILAVVGHASSGPMVAAAKIYDGNLAAVATTATSPAISGISPWVFRVISSDSANGVDLARFAERLGKRRVAIIYENNAYGRGLAEHFSRNFKGDVITNDPISDSGSDSELYISWFLARRPDLVFVATTSRAGVSIMREARRQELDVDFLGGDGWTQLMTEPAAEGIYVGAPFTAADPRERAQKYVAAFRERYKVEPDGNSVLAYDATYLLVEAVKQAGPDRGRIRDWLAARGRDGAFEGVTGAIAFDSLGDPVGKAYTMTRILGGKLTVAAETK